ncbi:hypothetical protein [Mesobacillus subterraneus]|uniref:hypothetical protein n=1 Tax=Mesobacillus subterraneus TaxID=285983 RepID=UPI001CFE643D|nr:hypothetical protein [Mesobacillus subterraneus]
MQKLIYRVKYSWHSYQHGYLKTILKDCINLELKAKIEKKLEFHKKKAERIYYQLQDANTLIS